ncbi:MAG: P-loop NTPase [Candidatus Hydrothermarchaeales archaeon]
MVKKKVEDRPAVMESMEKIKHKIVIMSGKGGVGKTTVAANLAVTLSLDGVKVGLLDMDLTGPNIPKMLGIEDRRLYGDKEGILPTEVSPNLKVVSTAFFLEDRDAAIVWRGPMKMGVIKQLLEEVYWNELDYLIIDLPPGTSDEPLSVAQNIPETDGVVIVTTPQDVALLDIRKAINFARAIEMPIMGIIENMSGFKCPHCNEEIDIFKVGGGEAAAKELGIQFLGRIPIDADIVKDGDAGHPFVLVHPDSKSAKAFREIVKNIEASLSKG